MKRDFRKAQSARTGMAGLALLAVIIGCDKLGNLGKVEATVRAERCAAVADAGAPPARLDAKRPVSGNKLRVLTTMRLHYPNAGLDQNEVSSIACKAGRCEIAALDGAWASDGKLSSRELFSRGSGPLTTADPRYTIDLDDYRGRVVVDVASRAVSFERPALGVRGSGACPAPSPPSP